MALRIYRHKDTGEERRSLKKIVDSSWQEVLVPPGQKFMIAADSSRGTSKIKDSDKALKARARNHSRDVLGDDNIQINLDMGSKESVSRNLLNEKGQRRRKIDDV